MRTLGTLGVIFATLAGSAQAQNMAAPPAPNPFSDPIYTAPNSRTLPGGQELVPEQLKSALSTSSPLKQEFFWGGVDYLQAWGKSTTPPALFTSAPVGTPLPNAGVLGQSGTKLELGGNRLLSNTRPSFRAAGGVWLTHDFGIDGSFLMISEVRRTFRATDAPGGRIYARPLSVGGVESAIPFDQVPSSLFGRTTTATMGGDVALRYTLSRGDMGHIDLLAGYRYLNLRDRVVVETTQVQGPASNYFVSDAFLSRNEFHGPEVGFATQHRLLDRFTIATRMTVGLGVTISQVKVEGSSDLNGNVLSPGIFAAASNVGRYRSTHFGVMPVSEVQFGYDATDRLRFQVGYTFLYWNDVRRSADQIDRSFPNPIYPNKGTDYWVQGVTLGMQIRY